MVVGVCGFAPYNDYVVANTFLVGCFLPLAMVLMFFVLIVGVNAPLYRFKPSWALSSGELAVAMTLVLVGCSIPTQGLMRYFLPQLVAPFHEGASDQIFWQGFRALELPSWLFPVSIADDSRHSALIADFYARKPPDEFTPFGPWMIPLLGWGTFLGGWMLSLIALAAILRPQWGTNERLPFPLAQLELSLIQAPRPGHALNDLFRDRRFWVGIGVVFCIHGLSALNQYYPKTVPVIPLAYDLRGILSQAPWTYLKNGVKEGQIYFTFVGVAFLLPTRVSFSLWAIYLIVALVGLQQGAMGNDISVAAWRDQHLGAGVAFAGGVLWVGRGQWMKVMRHLFRGRSEAERRRDESSYRWVAGMMILGLGVMFVWLSVVGVQVWVSAIIIAFTVLSHLVVARVVAETGLPYFRYQPVPTQIYGHFPAGLYSGRDIYFTSALQAIGPINTRESLLTFAFHGLQVSENAEPRVSSRGLRGLVPLMVFSWILGFAVAAASSLWCYYNYAVPITPAVHAQGMINPDGIKGKIPSFLTDPVKNWSSGTQASQAHSSTVHVGLGFAITSLLYYASLRWASWPLLPVGYLAAHTAYLDNAWFSISLAWLAKLVIVRTGGYRLYLKAKPLFVGAIFGEALAAGVLLMVNLALAWAGYDYKGLLFLPS